MFWRNEGICFFVSSPQIIMYLAYISRHSSTQRPLTALAPPFFLCSLCFLPLSFSLSFCFSFFLSLSLSSFRHFLQPLLNLSYLSCIYVYVFSNSSLFCFTLQRYSAQRAKGTSLPYITVVSSFFYSSSLSLSLSFFFFFFFRSSSSSCLFCTGWGTSSVRISNVCVEVVALVGRVVVFDDSFFF